MEKRIASTSNCASREFHTHSQVSPNRLSLAITVMVGECLEEALL